MRALVFGFLVAGLAGTATAGEDWVLTPNGAGPLRIGMSLSQVSDALKQPLEIDESDPDAAACSEIALPGMDHAWAMFEDGRLARISIDNGSSLRTERDIGIGDTEADVKAAYKSLDIKPRDYVGLPAKDITWWSQPGRRGIRFQTDESGHIDTIHAGGPSIEYMEGCL
jgi:hypothetical protein